MTINGMPSTDGADRQFFSKEASGAEHVHIATVISFCLLFWPTNIPGVSWAIGGPITLISLIVFASLLPIITRTSSKIIVASRSSIIVLLMLSLVFYGSVVTLNPFGAFGKSYYDLSEVMRWFGLFLFFALGRTYAGGGLLSARAFVAFFVIYIGLNFLLLVYFYGNISFLGPVAKFYLVRDGRFSGLSASINYLWASTLFAVLTALLMRSQARGAKSSRSFPGITWGVILISALALLSSGSRTSMALTLAGGFLYFVFRRQLAYPLISVGAAAALFLMVSSSSSLMLEDLLGDRLANRISEVGAVWASGDLQQIESFESRVQEYQRFTTALEDTPLFGHGVVRAKEPYFHNSFQRTYYRYGPVGLLLELTFYVSVILGCLKNIRNPLSAIALALIACYVVGGMVSLVFYELRLPYLMFYVMGAATSFAATRNSKGDKCGVKQQ